LGKGIPTDKQIEQFTVDRELDLVLAKYDALGPCKNVGQIGLLTTAETESLVAALEIIVDVEKEIS
jgi:argininosuccinate lyase